MSCGLPGFAALCLDFKLRLEEHCTIEIDHDAPLPLRNASHMQRSIIHGKGDI